MHIYIRNDVTRLIYTWRHSFLLDWCAFICDMKHSYVTGLTHTCHNLLVRDVTWRIHVWHDPFVIGAPLYVTWRIHTRHDSIVCDRNHTHVAWLVRLWLARIHMWHDAFIVLTWLTRMWHDSFVCDMTLGYVVWLAFTRDMTHSCGTWLTTMWRWWFARDMPHTHIAWPIRAWRARIHMWHHAFIRHVTYLYTSWLICAWHVLSACVISHVVYDERAFIRDIIHSCVTCLTRMWHDSFVFLSHSCVTCTHSYVTCRIHTWHVWLICAMTHSYLTRLIHTWHVSFVCDRRAFICDMTHQCVTWLIHIWNDLFVHEFTTHMNATRLYTTQIQMRAKQKLGGIIRESSGNIGDIIGDIIGDKLPEFWTKIG